jgi:5-methylthioadenosine/S-adenosylhomocysteine deaminase
VRGDHVLPMTDGDPILRDGAVAIRAGAILDVGPAAELALRWDPTDTLRGGIVLPGLVNTHGHAAMTLYRGLGDDLPLMDWLERCIWPAEKQFTSRANVRLGTELAVAEMLASGTTTFADMYFHEGEVGEVCAAAGMRVLLGQAVIGFPTPDCPDTNTSFRRCHALLERFASTPLVDVSLALHSTYTLSPEQLTEGARHAADWGIPVQIHMSETRGEVAQCVERHGESPPRLLARTGLLRAGTILAHGVHLDDAEIDLIAASGAGIALNPDSNLKLGSGVARVPELLASGIPLGLGTDGAASNNTLDLWHAVRLTALLSKGLREDPTLVPAVAAVRLATRGGAALLGLSGRIGSLETGKRADLCVIDTSPAALTPLYDPYSHLAYVACGRDVAHTVVDGVVVLRDGRHLTLDLDEVRARIARLAPGIAAFVRR